MAHRKATSMRMAIAAGVALAATGMARPAWAADDGYQNVFSSVLTAVGVMSPDKVPDIDYRERPPLVLPRTQALVKPEQAGAHRTAAWPNDPDVARRRKASEDAKAPIESLTRSNDHPVSREEQMKYRAATAQTEADDPYHNDSCSLHDRSTVNCRVDPDELKREEQRYKAMNPDQTTDKLAAGEEPERQWLTQPPKGYLKTTKDVKVTAEAPKPKRDDGVLSDYIHHDAKVDPLSD